MKTLPKFTATLFIVFYALISSFHTVQAGKEPSALFDRLSSQEALVTNSLSSETLLAAKKPEGRMTPLDQLAHDSKTYETLPFHVRAKVADLSIAPPYAETLSINSMTPASQYTMADLNKLSYEELAQLLITIRWNDIVDLFQFNPDSLKFYQDQDRVEYLIQALEQKGESYTATDSKGIETLVEVLRSGFYLGYYHEELSYLDEQSFHDKCLPALKSIAENSAFKLGTTEQDKVITAYGNLIGNASSNPEIVQLATPILAQFNDHFDSYAAEYSKGNALYSLLSGIDYDIDSYLWKNDLSPDESPWYRQIDAFIDEVGEIALYGDVTSDTGWIINNGIYYVSRLGPLHTNASKGLQIITEAMNVYPYLSITYFTAAQRIATDYDGIDDNGNNIDYDQLIEEGKDFYLPKKTTFDDGAIVIKTGANVSAEKIQRLYWASKEVKAQFHRVIGSDTPVTENRPDDTMTSVIYNNPEEYQMNRILYGYSTDNGGMYIEREGTFYTYERTPDQSAFSLEDLFRHEFTHYLQGRYLVPNYFGEGRMYENERLTWFNEGNAEFFAGSTRTDQVVPRKSIINYLADDPSERYTLAQTLYATYGTWDFYNYSFALQSYMYNHRFDLLDLFNWLIRADRVSAYDKFRESLSQDTAVDQAYQAYMQQLIDDKDQYTNPAVSDDYLEPPGAKSLAEIQEEITQVLPLDNASIDERSSNSFGTFILEGTYTGASSSDPRTDWQTLNTVLDQTLDELATKSWHGYQTVTAYFTNYRVNAQNKIEADVFFHGAVQNVVSSIEPNETIEQATPLPLNMNFTGQFDANNALDIYKIDVSSSQQVDIEVENTDELLMNWVVYAATDLDTPVSYATVEDEMLVGSFQADPGSYYLYVYPYGDSRRSGGYNGTTLTQ